MEEIKEIISEDPPPIDTDTPEVDVPESEDQGERQEFIFKELYASDDLNEKRFAKNGETLYLMKSTKLAVSNKDTRRSVNYSVIIDPKSSNIDDEDIVWEYDDFNRNRKYVKGVVNFKRDIYEKNEGRNTTKVEAGRPEKSKKSIDVKWFEENFRSDNFALDFGKLELIKNALRKLDFPTYTTENDYENANDLIKVLLSPKYINESKNIESITDRLYYEETKNIINLSIGISGAIEKPLPSLAFPKFKGTFFGNDTSFELGIYWYIGANALGQINATKKSTEWIEDDSKNETSDWSFTEGTNFSLYGNAGLNPKLVAKLGENGATISGKSDAKIEFLRIDSKGDLSVPFIEEGIKLSCTPVVNISLGVLSYDHKFQKYEYNLKFW